MPVSLASATVEPGVNAIFADLSAHSALMTAAGEMIGLAARHLRAAGPSSAGIRQPYLARRAKASRRRSKAMPVDLTALDKELAAADIVVSCTASTLPLVPRPRVGRDPHTASSPIPQVDLAGAGHRACGRGP